MRAVAFFTASSVPPGGLKVRWISFGPFRAGITLTSASRSPCTSVAETVREDEVASAGEWPVSTAVTERTAIATTTSVATDRQSGWPSMRRRSSRRLPQPSATRPATNATLTSRIRP